MEINQEIAIDFAGPFQNAPKAKQYLLVSIDHLTGWPEAKFLRKPITEKVIEFLKNNIARHGIPQNIRTDPATIFRSKRFKAFCAKRQTRHIKCAIKDHRGNGKIERLIRTINERLRINKQIVLTKDQSSLSEYLFALRMYPSKSGKSSYERYVGNETNTIKKLLISRSTTISDPAEVKLSTSDFESGQDSTILVRERARGSKLESAYKKRKGKLLEQSEHTITFLPAASNQKTVISKRDLANQNDQPCSSKEADRRLLENQREMAELLEMPETTELPFYNNIPEPHKQQLNTTK